MQVEGDLIEHICARHILAFHTPDAASAPNWTHSHNLRRRNLVSNLRQFEIQCMYVFSAPNCCVLEIMDNGKHVCVIEI